jgi:hypothetical protein
VTNQVETTSELRISADHRGELIDLLVHRGQERARFCVARDDGVVHVNAREI